MRAFATIASFSALVLCGCPGDDSLPAESGTSTSTSTGQACTANPSDGCLPATGSGGAGADDTLLDTTAATDPTTSGADANECAVSVDCAPEFCVAPFDPELGVFGRGPFACVAQCVPLDDELQWCADVEACCDPNATCTDRGYCQLPGADATGSGTETGSGWTTGDTGSTGQ